MTDTISGYAKDLEAYFQARDRVESQTYRLTLTGKQARYIQQACDLYERIHAGQWFAISELLPCKKGVYVWEIERALREFVEPLIDKDKLKFERIGGDISRVIRHRLAWDIEPQGGSGVNFSKPFEMSGEPLPHFEQVKHAEPATAVIPVIDPKQREK